MLVCVFLGVYVFGSLRGSNDENAIEDTTLPATEKTENPPVSKNKPKKESNITNKKQHDRPFIFGIGTELDSALNHRITKEAPVKMISSWYNGPESLGFMNSWRTAKVPQAYKAGYSLHLIIYTNDKEKSLNTAYGPACGRPYPLSDRFLADMQQLANIFKGGVLYVSMFTELQTYPCEDNNWVGSANYYRALQDKYIAAMKVFHAHAPGSKVSLSWGGWQANWDDPAKGGGASLIKHFAGVMNASDFQSFQAMSTTGNLEILTKMTSVLSPYAGDVMVAHYKPDNGSQIVFDSDMREIFTPANMNLLQQQGLFAFSFMDSKNMISSESSYQSVKKTISTYSR